MGKVLGRACALTAVCFAHFSAGYAVTAGPAALEPRATQSSTNTACALASSASSSYLVAQTQATQAKIPADLAYECLKSVPNFQEPALRLLNALRTYLEFQSDKVYLQEPPSGYLFPPVELDAELDTIQAKVESRQYKSEYDMQIDITSLLISAKDGHLYWFGDLMGAFTFVRHVELGLAAVSVDGVEQPQVYMADDLVLVDSAALQLRPVTGYTPSPVTSIDGEDVVSFLLVQSLIGMSQDPDALWNQDFFQLGNQNTNNFQYPYYYPGPTTNLTFANGTTRQFSNFATVNLPLDSVKTGDEAYAVFCSGALDASGSSTTTASAAASTTAAATTTQEAPSSPTVPLFPYPVIKHSLNSVAGYYLNGTGLTDVAVLQIQGFEAPQGSPDDLTYAQEFQAVVQNFLNAAVKSGKSKLIIDLQGNGGGDIDLGTDLFAQLFPSIPPNSKSNLRDHLGFWILGNVASSNVTADRKTSDEDEEVFTEVAYSPMAYQGVVTDDFRNFPNFQSYYGNNELYGGNFSAFFQNNYTDISSSDFDGEGIIITGTNNRTEFRQPFAAQDIVVLYDGYCASTCTVVSEYLKSAGVQFIAVGGRPQTGPMQAVGGIKGSQVFDYASRFYEWVSLFQSPENDLMHLASGTIWENFTFEPLLRASAGGVNGRNHFRLGDETNTPLQYVYEAADCRLWWTHEMLYDPTFLWARVATVAFQQRIGTQFNSPYCVQGSTGHPTSISGGWKNGTLGPQSVPENATATVGGWNLTGKSLGSGSGSKGPAGDGNIKLKTDEVKQSSTDDSASATLKQFCSSYTEDKWLIKLICKAVGS
ncbi:hypothetical protein EDD36DRAFT_25269 [Exophiala viscosa]|uniref:Tail specific protease domain-containing protein n=1 Tax=Exophiala viscosa TaxID=2486360 RepID=A0AAN6E5F9_9EURO|nr:hypothetical protein EDD36DRAFT_25269 [Exophiala viscosa]